MNHTRTISGGVGGILTNSFASKTFGNSVNGIITLGANGGVMAGTTNTELVVQENIDGAGSLSIGTTAIIDGAPKLGTVALGSAAGSNTYTGGTIINAGTLRMGYADVLGATTNPLTVNTGGRLLMNGLALTVGNLTGTGGVIASGGALTIGQGDNGGGNYQGSIQNSTALTKTGTAIITLSGTNTYTGVTTINAGKLFINGNQSSATGNVTVAANATLGGRGTIGGSTTIAAGGKLEFDLSTMAGSHNPLDLIAGKALTFSGASVLTITSTTGASPGIYPLVTGGNNIGGVAPATLNLPANWVATVSISGNSLLLNVTSTGGTFVDWIDGFTGLGGLTAFDADADGDGIKNGVEAFFGTAPNAPNPGFSAVASIGNSLTFTHPEADPPLTDLTGSYEWSLDLSNWSASGNEVNGTTVAVNAVRNTPQSGTTTVTATITGTESGKIFVRAVTSRN